MATSPQHTAQRSLSSAKRKRGDTALARARTQVAALHNKCRLLFEQHAHKRRSGLLPALAATFGWSDSPQRVSGRRYRTSSSRELGIRVEQELAQYVDGSRAKREHRVTGWLLRAFESRGWTLLATQVPLVDPVSGVYTWIDFIAHDATSDRLVLIELKTGYDAGYTSALADAEAPSQPRMLPLINVPDSYSVRHALQLCFMDWALRHIVKLPRDAFFSCVVRVANRRKTRVRPPRNLPRWATLHADDIVALIRERARATTR